MSDSSILCLSFIAINIFLLLFSHLFFCYCSFYPNTDLTLQTYTLTYTNQRFNGAITEITVNNKIQCAYECTRMQAAGFNVKVLDNGNFLCQIADTGSSLENENNWNVLLLTQKGVFLTQSSKLEILFTVTYDDL